jgi:hypothetical protein
MTNAKRKRRRASPEKGGAVAQYKIYFRDERGVQDLELDDVQLEDGIYELWRGKDVIERIPADQIDKVEPAPQ